jgi:glucose-6-phosphate isomerase
LNLDHANIDLVSSKFREKIEKIKRIPTPNFAKYIPDIEKLRKLREKYSDKKNVIVEGNGGAIENFRSIFTALSAESSKNVYMLDTEDPDYIFDLMRSCDAKDTLVILTSKSGTRIQVLANYFALKEFPILIITEDNKGSLNEIRKINNHGVSFYPSVEMTDRFTGLTESALTTSEIVGINSEEMIKGGKDMHEMCDPKADIKDNIALRFALTLDSLEKIGYNEMFLSIYSKKLAGFYNLISQLFHEGVCKNGVGQTIYGGEAPENQHHTLQRFISGRKNSVGVFLTIKNFSHKEIGINVDDNLKKVICRNITMEKLNKISLESIIHAEFQGTWQDVTDNKIPAINFEIDDLSGYSVGGFMAFFQYAAFYSAILRGVNPCDQPGVEKSKENIFRIIAEFT